MTEKRLSLGVEIPNQNLKASDIPSSTSSWDEIAAFAGSFTHTRMLKPFVTGSWLPNKEWIFSKVRSWRWRGSDSASYVRSFFFIGVRYATDTVAVSRRNRKWFTP